MDFSNMTRVLDAGEAKAKELGVAVSMAIVDEAGILVAFRRMPGAITISPRFSITKAYTSGTLGLPTSGIGAYAGEGKPYYGITSILSGDLTAIAGGLPIMVDKKLAGGIGVGGSTDVSQDEQIATAMLKGL